MQMGVTAWEHWRKKTMALFHYCGYRLGFSHWVAIYQPPVSFLSIYASINTDLEARILWPLAEIFDVTKPDVHC